MSQADCPFCLLPEKRVRWQSDLFVAFDDGFPVTPGHLRIIPKRHVASIFELSGEEQAHLWQFVSEVREEMKHHYGVDAFTIGVNGVFGRSEINVKVVYVK